MVMVGRSAFLFSINITNIKLSFLNHILVFSTGSQQYCCCVNLYPMNAPDPFKSASYERTKWVRCGHLNALHSHVQA